jgi:hypothetical protein
MADERLVSLSKHPLLVLFVGTLLGSILVPWVNGRAARAADLEKLRAQKAVEALDANSDIDRKLNIVITAFESFWKDTSPAQRQAERSVLRKRVYELYQDFDRSAWWWFEEEWRGCQLLGLLDEQGVTRAEAITEQYKTSLTKTTACLDDIWRVSIEKEPIPNSEEAALVLAAVRSNFFATRDERMQLVGDFTALLLKNRVKR